ncbi:sugar ABC transporter ATP-binding protein [Caproiciproducens sp. CPB-2]|uniref:sugar ABC transporter ATP-binding protein n=1 Tax=Caproiciproducens sp. CPB-2 TaxID=3030017 RepID=UPI0023DC774F|nr:sugar ABC transporter ATP-binding protein [Caproiciproducens sp. CPB-2]MDF1494951.1 sugar ABC transporter ATP-binding protein [Caproiciproducens sp. CPB-2]
MEDQYIVQMEDITVRFPGVLALDKVRLDVEPGEVHVLIGENGAGKSTIMKVLAGVNTDYEGKIIYKGEEIVSRSVDEQRARGISIIFQEMNLLRNLTVAENIFMGRQPTKRGGQVDWKRMYSQARELLDSINSDISERALVSTLSVGQMQMVEIAKALSFKCDIIIMDEPTSALTEREVDSLFAIIKKLKEQGVAVIYISHRLEEILRIGDRVTVFRDGKYIDTVNISDTTIDQMVAMMVGRELNEYYPKVSVAPGEKLLEVSDLIQGNTLKGISFYARAGEITCFYGLMGAGRTELLRAVFGADPYDSGEIRVKGKTVKIASCEQAKNIGLALLTEDRKNQGLILSFSLNQNISLTNMATAMTPFGFNRAKETAHNQRIADSIHVKTPSLEQKAKNLSGGNQQKVVICKWLNTDSDIIMFDEPTRGIDVGAKAEIYKIMNSLKEQGKAVIMVTSELSECMGISDRIYVMHEGALTGLIEGEEIRNVTEEMVVGYATGTKTNLLMREE